LHSAVLMGQYLAGHSIIHRMDPRMKCGLMIPTLIASVFIRNWWSGLGVLTFLVFTIAVSGIPWRVFGRHYLAFSWLLVITVGLHVFMDDGRVLWTLPWLGWHVTQEGIQQGGIFGGRLVYIIGISNLLMLTTAPGDLAEGAERLFRPLRRLGVPTGEVGLMVGMALRFIPTIFEEGRRIRLAQRARGSERDPRFHKRIINFVSVIFPLYLSVFRRAHQLAVAMEARGYQPGMKRTSYREFNLGTVDYAAVTIVTVMMAGLWVAG
jgi:energy-coupling factor transport system permease protein